MPISKEEVSFTYDVPIPDDIPKGERKSFLKEIGEYLVDAMLDSIAAGVSPVGGKGKFKQLNKKYADEEKGGNREANLDLNGDMLSSLTYKVKGNKVVVGIFEEDQAVKAYGHNTGFKGHPVLEGKAPARPFIPKENETFSKKILEGVEYITEDYTSGKGSMAADQ